MRARPPYRASDYRTGFAVGSLTLALYAPTALQLSAPVTYLSAVRVAGGELLYRDMWTMYAPGSIYTMAALFKLFGVHLIIGNILGVLVSTAAVLVLYRLTLRVARPWAGAVVAMVFACALLGAGYQNSLASYPPAILCLLAAADRIARHGDSGERRELGVAGIFLGIAVLFKHDVGGYASIALAVSMFATPRGTVAETFASVTRLAVIALAVVTPAVLALIWAGAGPAMLEDLVIFPTGYFPTVRPESFPLLPPWPVGGRLAWARETVWWVILTWPTLAVLTGCVGLYRSFRGARPDARRLVVFALVAYAFFWSAAHVQANTHKVTMAALGGLIGAAGVLRLGTREWNDLGWMRYVVALFVLSWVPALTAEQVALRLQDGLRSEFVGLPRFEGILAPRQRAEEMRTLSAALERAAPPEAPILVVGWRNDVMIAASSLPYWLSPRTIVTAHHELHPGITDTEPVQRQMIRDASTDPPPVVVLEYRFNDTVLDLAGAAFRAGGVPVGSTLLDEWVAEHYAPGPRYGINQLMVRKR